MMKLRPNNRTFALGLALAVGAGGDNGSSTAGVTESGSSSGSTGGSTTDDPTASTGSPTSAPTTSGVSMSGTDSSSTTSTDPTTGTTTDDETTTTTTTGVVPMTTGTTDETTGTTTDDTSTTGTTDETTGTTTDSSTTDDTDSGTTGEPLECGKLIVTYRDFMPLHTDFGCHMNGNGARPGLVMPDLGADQKPVYNPNPPPPPPGWGGTNPQITNQTSFDQWYNTVDGVNVEIQSTLELMELMPGLWSFSSNMFYPLTGMGFGNNITPNWAGETYPNWNGAFTTEIHTTFLYELGQQFTFRGDDDVWVFIDGKLALDIGGLHGPVEASVNLDTLGLAPNNFYTLDVFHAERCGSGSNFRIDTSISCFKPQ